MSDQILAEKPAARPAILFYLLLVGVAAAAWCGVHLNSAGALLLAASLVLLAPLARAPQRSSVLVSLSMVLLGLALADWFTPFVFPPGPQTIFRTYASGYRSGVTEVGVLPSPGAYRSERHAADGTVIYDVTYTVGPDQLRVTPDNPAGPYRVNFFGCSFTYGEGLRDDETLPYYFSQAIRTAHVMNFGYHGRGANNALALLESNWDTTGDINFFLGAGFQVERGVCHPDWTVHSPRYELLSDGSLKRNGACGEPRGLSDRLLTSAYRYSNILAKVDNFLRSHISDDDVRLYLATLRRMASLSHARGQKFVVGYINDPNSQVGETSYPNNRIMKEIASFADDLIDMALPPDPRNNIGGDGHPSGYANQKRAAILAGHLAKYLP